ncbi:FRG domain-containing protein [Curvibacter sp. AEP1-3]|uniref:FRG domain-containing protein n=1 Tax=Curvibacter sp. AEP1-3 TaxID=1844971 RepID=UPI0012FA3561|nr:FRG domain-containing protein [Curvibacter sp. AEP1-3]
MPKFLAEDLWKIRADTLLSGGALSGRLLFENLISSEVDSIKRSQVPELVVRSESHLFEIVTALKERAAGAKDVQLWFRGQRADHKVPDRKSLLPFGLTPYSNISESSLVPSLYRRFDEHFESFDLYEQFLHELTEWVDAARHIIPDDASLSSNFVQRNPHALSASGLTSFQRGLVLQQYGAPSTYLDITSDPMIATWFATHKCIQDEVGVLDFSSMEWSGDDTSKWPTIFVLPLVVGAHPFLDLSSILPGDVALRPKRQSCGLIGGAGNLARNYCARYVGLKLRLHPQFRVRTQIPAEHLFPSDAEDPAMRHLRSLGLGAFGRRFPLTSVCSN